MEDSPTPQTPDLGQAWAEWPRAYDDVLSRSSEVALEEHLLPEDVERLSLEATELGVTDVEGFLKVEVVRFGDIIEVHPELSPSQLTEFIDQYLAATRDGAYS
jgi:hypothetical protein